MELPLGSSLDVGKCSQLFDVLDHSNVKLAALSAFKGDAQDPCGCDLRQLRPDQYNSMLEL